jgi:PadR family transcriptional regulator PadR
VRIDLRTEDLKKVILKLFSHKEFYGYEVHKVLASEGVELEISRLYRVLNDMRKEGLLESSWETSRLGPRKRMYRLGEKGRVAFNDIFVDAIKTVHTFYGTYLLGLIPKINVFEEIYRLLTNELKENEIIVFITKGFTPMHEMIVQHLHSKLPRGKIVLVKPGSLIVDVILDNLLLLDGFHNDIPLKTDYADHMIVINLPTNEHLELALKEWHRVLKPNGKLAILTPSILLEKYDDPLTIGDFIEKHEHETIEKGEHIDKIILKEQVKHYFKNIEEKSLVHMTTLKLSEPVQLL